MSERKPEPNGRSAPPMRHPPLQINAPPEALAKALLRPLAPPDPSLRKQRRSEG